MTLGSKPWKNFPGSHHAGNPQDAVPQTLSRKPPSRNPLAPRAEGRPSEHQELMLTILSYGSQIRSIFWWPGCCLSKNRGIYPWKQTAGTWKYPRKEKEKHRPKPPIFGFHVCFRGCIWAPNMDGENNGKPLWTNGMIWGYHYFWKHPCGSSMFHMCVFMSSNTHGSDMLRIWVYIRWSLRPNGNYCIDCGFQFRLDSRYILYFTILGLPIRILALVGLIIRVFRVWHSILLARDVFISKSITPVRRHRLSSRSCIEDLKYHTITWCEHYSYCSNITIMTNPTTNVNTTPFPTQTRTLFLEPNQTLHYVLGKSTVNDHRFGFHCSSPHI